MLHLAARAFSQTFSAPLRRILWRALAISLLVLTVLGVLVQAAVGAIPILDIGWLDAGIEFLARFIAFVVLVPLVFPVTTLVAGFFLDGAAADVEARDYPADPPGRDTPLAEGLCAAMRFTLVLIGLNLLSLPFYLVPGLNVILFWALNGYLLGREYFELVALRHHPWPQVRAARRRHAARLTSAGVVIALFASVPLLNLLTPLFATVLMVHLHKEIAPRALSASPPISG